MSEFTLHFDPKTYSSLMYHLDALENIDKRNAMKKAFKTGAKDLIAVGRSNLRARNKVRKGNLRSSFTNRLYRRTKGIYVGFRRPKGAAAHLVDRGTVERYTKKGAYRGKITGTLFWTDAVNSEGHDMLNKIADTIITEVNKIVK